jgi:hypothetical protein
MASTGAPAPIVNQLTPMERFLQQGFREAPYNAIATVSIPIAVTEAIQRGDVSGEDPSQAQMEVENIA